MALGTRVLKCWVLGPLSVPQELLEDLGGDPGRALAAFSAPRGEDHTAKVIEGFRAYPRGAYLDARKNLVSSFSNGPYGAS